MGATMTDLTFTPPDLRHLTERVFVAANTPPDLAAIVAADLVDANLAGHDSHGVIRIPQYLHWITTGVVRPDRLPIVVADHGATLLVSGEWGFGQVSGRQATDLAVERAGQHGIAAVALLRANHLGRLGGYVERGAAAGRVVMMWVGGLGGANQAVPYGGTRSALGTNPLAAGFPAGNAGPIILDFATTAVAGGKIMVAHDRGEQLPPNAVLDRHGQPTTDPAAYLDGGAMLPIGGHKGYALAVIVELLAQALTGADTTGDDLAAASVFARSGALVIALDTGAFRPAADTTTVAAEIAARIRAVPAAPGFDRVQLPGEPEARSRVEREARGIPLPRKTWDAIADAATGLGIPRTELPAPAPER